MSWLHRPEPLSLRDLAGPSIRVQAALSAPCTRESVTRLVLGMAALALHDGAISLRIAMLLAWIKGQDLADLGYPSYSAFCRERVEWTGSWLRDLVRLVESPLNDIKAAACQGLIPLRAAVGALQGVAPEDQRAWLMAHASGSSEPEPPAPRRELVAVSRADASVVQRARQVARLLMGRHASLRQVDDQIVAWHQANASAEQLLADAREAPAPPERHLLDWSWCAEVSPASALVGPWREPTSLREAVARVERLQLARRGRVALLSRAWALICHERIWAELGFPSTDAFAREVLGWSRRTAQRHRKLGRALEWHPELDRALRSELAPVQAALIGQVVHDDAQRWMALAARVGYQELRRAVERAESDGSGRTLARYERAVALVDRWQAGLGVGAEQAGGAGGGAAEGVTGPGDREPEGASAAGTSETASADSREPLGASAAGTSAAASAGERSEATSVGNREPEGARAAAGDRDPEGAGAAAAGRCEPGSAAGTPEAGPDITRDPDERPDIGRPRVALPLDPCEAADRSMRAPAELPAAARWLVARVQIPKQFGFGKVKERDGFRCQNPECRRLGLRCEAHHILFRSRGGSDDPHNGVTVCKACHLRAIHTGRITVELVSLGPGLEAVLWTYLGERQVLVLRAPRS